MINSDEIIKVGVDVLNTTFDPVTKSITAQLGDVVTEQRISDNAVWLQHVGFISRPPKPDPKKTACQAVAVTTSSHDVCIASRDLRGHELAGSIGPGETCVYAPGALGTSQARMLLKDSGAVAFITAEGNTLEGGSATISVDSDGNIVLASSKGAIVIKDSGITLISGNSALKLGSDGNITLIGNAAAINAGSVSIGAGAIIPAVIGPTGITGVASTSVKIAS